nr:ribonuclease H-like domain-containing protein [Tanacetum cinerariifolium]
MRMEQYLTHTDYALWEVIMNGDAPASIASVIGRAKTAIPPKTNAEKIARRNELKAKSTLLLAIPDEHLLKFHGTKDAKTLGEAIKTSFGDNTSSLNEAVNTDQNVFAASLQRQASTSTYADDVMFLFFATQSNSLQLDNEDLEQIDTDDLEEMDLKFKTVNDDVRLQALVDGKKVIVNEASIICDLRLDDVEGTACLPNAAIFEELAKIRKHKSRRKQRKETKVPQTKPQAEDHIHTPSHDPLPIGEDRLGGNDQDLFRLHDLDGDEVFMDVTTGENVEQNVTVAKKIKGITATITLQISNDDVTLAQTLMEIKAAKPKAKEVTIQEPSEFRTTSPSQPSQPPQAKDKELKRCLEIVPVDDDDVAIKATPLSSKSPTIVDYMIYREGKKSYFKIIWADGNSQNYLTFGTMFKSFNREDLKFLRSIVKERFKKTKLVDDMDNLLFQTLKTMFEHHVKDII